MSELSVFRWVWSAGTGTVFMKAGGYLYGSILVTHSGCAELVKARRPGRLHWVSIFDRSLDRREVSLNTAAHMLLEELNMGPEGVRPLRIPEYFPIPNLSIVFNCTYQRMGL